jgi:hypothetical protein
MGEPDQDLALLEGYCQVRSFELRCPAPFPPQLDEHPA